MLKAYLNVHLPTEKDQVTALSKVVEWALGRVFPSPVIGDSRADSLLFDGFLPQNLHCANDTPTFLSRLPWFQL
jgi:hypothetical protein